ncbi:hypothetical protein GCM10027449_24810 [Sinomonas notoginsengisoli]
MHAKGVPGRSLPSLSMQADGGGPTGGRGINSPQRSRAPGFACRMTAFPNAARAARHHIGTAVKQLAAAVDELRGLGADEDVIQGLSANAGNGLA